MISLPQNLPMVRWADQRDIPLSEEWLEASLYQSAELAGIYDWDMCGQVARAIIFFLQRDFHENMISIEQMEHMMRKSLHGIGCTFLIPYVQLVPPCFHIYLPDIARQAPYELLFFSALGERLHEALQAVVRGVKLEGLRDTVKMLNNRRRWMPDCQNLSEEIVAFSRKYLQKDEEEMGLELVIC